MMIVEVNNKLVIVSVNCPEENIDDWKPIAKDIMNSIKIK
jgi:tetrahydromethanopterin S-methyltransferase subunit B